MTGKPASDFADQLNQAAEQLEKAAAKLREPATDLSGYVPGALVREAAGFLAAAGGFLRGAAVQISEALDEKQDKPG